MFLKTPFFKKNIIIRTKYFKTLLGSQTIFFGRFLINQIVCILIWLTKLLLKLITFMLFKKARGGAFIISPLF